MRDPVLGEAELEALLAGPDGPAWALSDGRLIATVACRGFVGAMAFVVAVAEAAEAAGHHPDIDIRYDRVELALVTHDSGGVTRRDVELARTIDAIAAGRA